MGMNDDLKKLYESKWNELLNNATDDATHPLLIQINGEYENADIKVMIAGQETDGWGGNLKGTISDVCKLMDKYKEYLYSDGKKNKKNRRPFWNRKNFRYFQEKIPKIYENKTVSFVWNNVSKIGKTTRGKSSKETQMLEKEYFTGVFEEELKILKPNIIIFRTGDRAIQVNHKEICSVREKPVEKIELTSFPDIFAVRTYHPNAKIEGGKKEHKKEIINLIKTQYSHF